MRARVLTRYGYRLLPARQGRLRADDVGGGVTHSPDGEEALEELAGRPGGGEHGRVAGLGAAGRTGAVGSRGAAAEWAAGVGRRERGALAGRRAGGSAGARARRAVLPPHRNREITSASGRAGRDRGRVLALAWGRGRGHTCEFSWLPFGAEFPGGRQVY